MRVSALSVEQESAITLLLTGATDQSVATRLKLSRATNNRAPAQRERRAIGGGG